LEGIQQVVSYEHIRELLDFQKGIPEKVWQPAQENTVLSPKPIHFGH
jgi:hypothetical protein